MYRQRAAVERINSQAFHLGIERPHLRNGSAIANLNTLIYTLINLRLFHRLHQQNTPASLSDNGTSQLTGSAFSERVRNHSGATPDWSNPLLLPK
jgi:hypothetical protein